MNTSTVLVESECHTDSVALFSHLLNRGYGFTTDCARNYAAFEIQGIHDAPGFYQEVRRIAPSAEITTGIPA